MANRYEKTTEKATVGKKLGGMRLLGGWWFTAVTNDSTGTALHCRHSSGGFRARQPRVPQAFPFVGVCRCGSANDGALRQKMTVHRRNIGDRKGNTLAILGEGLISPGGAPC